MNELIEHQKISVIVDNYKQIQADVKQAFELLNGARSRLNAICGDSYDTLFEDRISDYNLLDSAERSKHKINQQVWAYLFNQLGLRDFMSIKRKEELDKQLYKKESNLPEITEASIYETFQGLAGNVNGLMEEAVKEVFDWLRPHNWNSTYKTNNKFSIGQKVIKDYCVENFYGFRIQYNKEPNLRSLDNAFRLLDGKGVRHYPADIATGINTAMKAEQDTYEDEYFIFKWYLKGTLHIEFKRFDLLKKLNQIGGGMDLPGKEYKEEKAEAKAQSKADMALAAMGLSHV